MANKSNRRQFLQTTAAATVLSTARGAPARSKSNSIYLDKLGLQPVINGVGTVTVLGGSIMPPEVVQAMVEASKHFIQLPELQKKVGERIAELLKVPAAMVSCGAASAITVATAACVVSGDPAKLRHLPDTTGLKNEIVQQKSHRSGYEAQMDLVGTKIVWVETREELNKAINERTAMMFFLNKSDPLGQIKAADWIQVGKERKVPTFNDAAADVPPVDRLSKYVNDGFDLVAFSGGKGLLGPQGSGLLLGRKDLIEAAQHAINPHGGIGRGMKVGKEELMGLLAAVERYLAVDHAAERRKLESRVSHIIEKLSKIQGLTARQHVPEIANNVPHALLEWEEDRLKLSSQDVLRQLREGDPPIMVSREEKGKIRISVWMMQGDEHRIVAERLKEIFTQLKA
jgi:L-seryl-tRNA(Ser) seleniumtransferase